MGKSSKARFRIKIGKHPNNMWSLSIGLSHMEDETYLYINLFKWTICIGRLYEDWV